MTFDKYVGKLRCNENVTQVMTGKVRVWILVVTTLLLLLVFANMSAFNFTIICMIPPQSAIDGQNRTNGTNNRWSQEKIIHNGVVYYNYSSIERNALFSASALGLLLGCFPLSYLVSKYKIRHTFCAYALISALTTLLIPASVEMGYPFLFALRVLQGSGSSPSLMMINSVTDQWSPLATAGTFLIMLSTYCQFGPILTMPAAACLCESRWGWPMVYYLQGTLTLVLLVIFFAFFRDSPREHPLVQQQELLKIEKGKEEILKENREDRKNVPYRSIVTDYMVWICWLGFFGDELGYQVFQQYGPIFLNKALGMNVRDTGIAAALPFIVAIVTKLIAGPISDRMTCVSDRTRINIFSIISQVGTIVCYACLAVIPKLVPNAPIWLMQIFYTSINIFSGLGYLGLIKAAAVISRQHSHVLMAGEMTISALTILFIPLLVSLIAPHNTVEEWSRLFISIPFVQLTTLTLFLIFCDSKPRPWTQRNQKQGELGNDRTDEYRLRSVSYGR